MKKEKEKKVKVDKRIQQSMIFVENTSYSVDEDTKQKHIDIISEYYAALFSSNLPHTGESVKDDFMLQTAVNKWADILIILTNKDGAECTGRDSIIASSAATNSENPKTILVIGVDSFSNADEFKKVFNDKIKSILDKNHAALLDNLFSQKLSLVKINEKDLNKLSITNDGYLVENK